MRILIKISKGIKNLLITIGKRIKSILERIAEKPAIIGLILFIFFGAFVVMSVYLRGKSYEGNFLDSILVEAHGLLFDILVFGVLIVIFSKMGERRREIKRHRDEIDDFRFWESEEAMFRIAGNIKRLNGYGVSDIDLIRCYLKNAELQGVNFNGALLINTNLSSANLTRADLRNTHLFLADLREAELGAADLKDAYLRRANLEGVKYLKIKQLSQVKTLHEAKLDPELFEQIEKEYPHLLEKPKEDTF